MSLANIKKEFPILKKATREGRPLVYLDSAATTQKPLRVIEAIVNYYERYNANIHRGVYGISQQATEACERVREDVRAFIHAERVEEIVFTSGTTQSINLVARSFGDKYIKENDEIVLSMMEHHSNIVPWQLLCERTGAKLRIIPITDRGEIELEAYTSLLNERTKLVAITHISNVLGTINPIKEIVDLAHRHDIPVLVDGAQTAPHLPIDVRHLGCDFYAFSGHKMYGPMGIGVLYGQSKWLNQMPPYQGGGEMIKRVTFEKTLYADPPYRFEAGTQNGEGIIGLGAAVKFLQEIGFSQVEKHEHQLTAYALEQLSLISNLKVIGEAKARTGAISFTISSLHPHDIATILDSFNVAVRAGHHCAQPLMDCFRLSATTRLSFGVYNDRSDIDALIKGLLEVKKVFKLR